VRPEKEMAQPCHVVFGIDMSLSNPGVCRMDMQSHTLELVYWRNRHKERGRIVRIDNPVSPFYGWVVKTICFERPYRDDDRKDCAHRMARFARRLRPLLAYIARDDPCITRVGIEHYSFGSAPNRAASMLMELGGCLRLHLDQLGYDRVTEIAPSKVKRVFGGQGRANKNDMYKVCCDQYLQSIDLHQLIGIEQHVYANVPHPVEDMVDALAVAWSVAVAHKITINQVK